MSLTNNLIKFVTEYGAAFKQVWREERFSHPLGNFIRSELAQSFKDVQIIDPKIYEVKASCGAGRWSRVPWIAIFDKRITQSAQKGVYIVYLLNKDTQELYLTLNQAATGKSISELKNSASEIRDSLGIEHGEPIDTGDKQYDAGCICAVKYNVSDLSSEKKILEDLENYIQLYARYKERFSPNKSTPVENRIDFSSVSESSEVKSTVFLQVGDTVERINRYIFSKGFEYDEKLIENFYLSLKSKPFVLLAGISGTGKTRLVRLFAEAIGAEYKLVSVRPDWCDPSDLFGHLDLNGKFIAGEIIDFIKQAHSMSEKVHILCLDEMNLARVEHYFSDFLSVMETRRFSNGKLVSDKLINKSRFGKDSEAFEKYGELILPDNLYIVGTVNMDETTFPFSKKVLDRANTIEFSHVDLTPHFEKHHEDVDLVAVGNDFLRTEYLLLKQCEENKDFVEKVCMDLQTINLILSKADLHIGYRVRDEIVFYMLNNEKSALLSRDEAFDNEIMQKILPRIQGSSTSVKDILCTLFKNVCAGDYADLSGLTVYEQMNVYLRTKQIKYVKSAEKIAFMIRRFEEDGFTSYWI